MRMLVVGAGPGGLFLSLLAKRANPAMEIHVVEQNPENATYGWGVVFSEDAIAALRPAAPDLIDEVATSRPDVDRIDVFVREERRSINGNPFYRIGRADLLAILQRHAISAGVTLEFERRVESRKDIAGWDLVVGADGVNSVVRSLFADELEADIQTGSNWWAWYGTPRLFPAVSLIFEPRQEGLYVGHAYQYSQNLSGFVAELSPQAFADRGLDEMSLDQSRAHCEEIFAGHLDGAPLLDNRSVWFQPKFVSCHRWSTGNVTLLGDALHTVHPSIGSGTRFAMRDATALAEALADSSPDVPAVLAGYEKRRRPRADGFQAAARRSIDWYEGVAELDLSDATRFTFEYAMRTGRVRFEDFRRLNPQLIESFERPTPRSAAGSRNGGR